MPQVGGGAVLEEDDIEDAELLAPEEVEDDAALEPEVEAEIEPEPEPEPEVSIEDRARAMGWHPLAEYRGDPRRWVPAADFVRKAETETPIMRDQNRRMQEKITRLEGQVTSLQNTSQEQLQALREMRDLARRSNQQGYDRALADLKSKKREAVEAGDTVAYDQIDEQIGELEKSRPDPAPATPATPAMDPAIAAFTGRDDVRSWWDVDEQLTRAMIDHHSIIKGKHRAMPLAEQLDLAFRRVKADFPEQFGAEEEPEPMAETPIPTATPRTPARPAAVARPSGPGAGQARVRDRWELIADPAERAEAKAAFGRQQRQQPDMTQDEYLDLYLDPHADVLAVQAKRRKA